MVQKIGVKINVAVTAEPDTDELTAPVTTKDVMVAAVASVACAPATKARVRKANVCNFDIATLSQ